MSRPLFLSAFGAVYACAFISYWLQFDGLYAADGLLPAAIHHEQVSQRLGQSTTLARINQHPSLLWLLGKDDDIDVAMELIAAIGIMCALLATAGVHHGALFLAMFAAYTTLYAAGQTFLSFQWDLFLLETGACAILYANELLLVD